MKDIKKDPFDEYIKNLPPTRKELGQAWSTAIGLQDVDGLKPSEYLYETAKKNIDGEIVELFTFHLDFPSTLALVRKNRNEISL